MTNINGFNPRDKGSIRKLVLGLGTAALIAALTTPTGRVKL
mgnify:CR=1 FL=1